jgi:hypothetical protein
LLVVTLRTAQSRAALERTSRRCKDFTLPHRPSLTASAIRTCSRHTCRWTARQSTLDHDRFEDAQAAFTASSRFPSSRRISRLSRVEAPAGRGLPFGPGTQVPYPAHYKPAFASSSILSRTFVGVPCGRLAWGMGATTGTTLASEEGREDRAPPGTGTILVACGQKPCCGKERSGKSISRQRYGVSTFRFRSACGVRCLLSTGWLSNREGLPFKAPSGHLHLLVQACQPLWLVRA